MMTNDSVDVRCPPDHAEASALIVVHGLWLGPWAMNWLARRLAKEGLRVFRFGYASTGNSLDDNAAALARFARNIGASRIHWLGHSLGGVLICRTLSEHGCGGDGRVVTLAAPLRGSFAAERLARFTAGRVLLGRSIRDWLEQPADRWILPNELGVIAGTHSLGLGRLVAPDLPRPNDGVVSVEEARLPGAREFLTLPVSHSGMLVSAQVARHAASFLRNGTFTR